MSAIGPILALLLGSIKVERDQIFPGFDQALLEAAGPLPTAIFIL